jgi:CBS domain-containing protein
MRLNDLTVKDFCTTNIPTVDEETTIARCARMMHDFDVRSVIVVNAKSNQQKPLGILTDRDVTTKVVAFDLDAKTLTASDLMATSLACANEFENVMTALARMSEHRIRRMPVVDREGILIGVIEADNLLELLGERVDCLVHYLRASTLNDQLH